MSTLATTVPRKTAPRQAKPAARYWKGKAPKGADALPSDSEEEDEEPRELEEGDEAIEDIEEDGLEVHQQIQKGTGRGINVALRDVNISKDGKVIVAGKDEVGRTEVEIGMHTTRVLVDTFLRLAQRRRKTKKTRRRRKVILAKKRYGSYSCSYSSLP